MIEELFFLDEGNIKITAASVGISRRRWVSANEDDIESNSYSAKMSDNRFDILPIEISEADLIKEYFKTVEPNKYNVIKKHLISYNDTIPLDTDIQTTIEKFSAENRTFYFLTLHKEIKGLITIGNLNCKQVQVYLFNLICDLERGLGKFTKSKLSNDEIMDWIKTKSDNQEPNNKFVKMLLNYYELVSLDLENDISEHLFFIDFFNLIREKGLCAHLDYSKSKWDNFGSINEIRNRIAHPTRSLLDSNNTNEKLSDRLRKINELLFKLKNE